MPMALTGLTMISSCAQKSKRILLSLLFLALVTSVFCEPTKEQYIQRLIAESDYFRAISELKELRFYSSDDFVKINATKEIIRSYWLSQKYESGMTEIYRAQANLSTLPSNETWMNLYLGLNYYGQKLYPNALLSLEKASLLSPNEFYPSFYSALLYAELADWKSVDLTLKTLMSMSLDEEQKTIISQIQSYSASRVTLPSKSPFLAGLFSFILPGFGQAYTGHWVDAAQSFALVGIFGLATYAAYKYEDQSKSTFYPLTASLASATLIFHGSNIYGATTTAEFFNKKANEDLMNAIRETAFAYPLP